MSSALPREGIRRILRLVTGTEGRPKVIALRWRGGKSRPPRHFRCIECARGRTGQLATHLSVHAHVAHVTVTDRIIGKARHSGVVRRTRGERCEVGAGRGCGEHRHREHPRARIRPPSSRRIAESFIISSTGDDGKGGSGHVGIEALLRQIRPRAREKRNVRWTGRAGRGGWGRHGWRKEGGGREKRRAGMREDGGGLCLGADSPFNYDTCLSRTRSADPPQPSTLGSAYKHIPVKR